MIDHNETKVTDMYRQAKSVSVEEVKWRELRKISMKQRAAGIKQIEDVHSFERDRVDDLAAAKNSSSLGNGGELCLETKTQHR